MDESFMASDFIDAQLSRKQTSFNGYPAMDCKYKDKAGSIYLARFIIQGPYYYGLVAHGKKETTAMNNFLNSFEIKPFIYDEARKQKDTSLYFTVNTPVFPENKKIKLGNSRNNPYNRQGDDEDEESEDAQCDGGEYRNKTISNDTTGEKIYVSFYRSPRYYYTTDTAELNRDNEISIMDDTTWIVKLRKKTEGPHKMKIWETIVTDTGSSRTLWTKTFYKEGICFSLVAASDTLSRPGAFIKKFYDTFSPADTLNGINSFVRKSNLFFDDFMSTDSVLHKRAVRHIEDIDLDSSDLPPLRKAISWTNWGEKKYLDTKKSLISKLGDIKSNASANYLRELYYALDDTVQLQYIALENLLQHQTLYAFNIFRDIVNTEPPVLVANTGDYTPIASRRIIDFKTNNYRIDNGGFLDELTDSLQLTRAILPDLLPLLNQEDYKSHIMRLLGLMVDSNLVKPNDYEPWFSKFLIETKQELRKQSIAEKKKAIEKAQESKEEKKPSSLYWREEDKDDGNDELGLYATLLLPYWEIHPAVEPLLQQMLRSDDNRFKYRTMLLFLRNNKPFPDSLLNFFAGLDDYRYELYNDLKDLNRTNRFPLQYNNHPDLGRSSLLNKRPSGKPDSLVYLDRLPAEFKGRKGFIYFYKYKAKKDDLLWKLATAGLTPENPKAFEYEDDSTIDLARPDLRFLRSPRHKRYDFTGFTETKIGEDEGLSKQLNKALKRLVFSRHKSAEEFYDDDNDRSGSDFNMD